MKDERVYLGHFRDAINDIKSYAAVGEAAFLADRMRQDAVIRKLEIVGEAAKRISETTRARRPEIPWKQIAGMRDRLTHDTSVSTSVWYGALWSVICKRSTQRSTHS